MEVNKTLDPPVNEVTKPKRKPRGRAKKKTVNNTMDSFQDGRPSNSDSNDSFSSPMDMARMNHDMNSYGVNSNEHGMMGDHYGAGRMVDGVNNMPMYSPYNRVNPGMTDQHNMQMSGNMDYSNQMGQYTGHMPMPGMRPNYPISQKPSMVGMRPGMPHVMSSNAQWMTPQGQTIPPQSGPTPTLNQLLQAPNSNPRYPNSYNDYSSSHKGDMVPGGYPMQAGWGGSNRPMMPYGQSQMMNGPYRNQTGMSNDIGGSASVRRVPVSPYPNSGSPYPQQFSPNSPQQRYSGRPPNNQALNGQQPFNQTFPSNVQSGQQNCKPPNDQEDTTNSSLEESSDSRHSSTPTPAAIPRPAPSPVGSTGSRSNTPASLPGQVGSPRNSSQSDPSQNTLSPVTRHSPSPSQTHPSHSPMPNRTSPLPPGHSAMTRMPHSPMHTGYGSTMPPPNQMAYNKQPMAGYPPSNNPQYPQGNMSRMSFTNGPMYNPQQMMNRGYVPFNSYGAPNQQGADNSYNQFNGPTSTYPVNSSHGPPNLGMPNTIPNSSPSPNSNGPPNLGLPNLGPTMSPSNSGPPNLGLPNSSAHNSADIKPNLGPPNLSLPNNSPTNVSQNSTLNSTSQINGPSIIGQKSLPTVSPQNSGVQKASSPSFLTAEIIKSEPSEAVGAPNTTVTTPSNTTLVNTMSSEAHNKAAQSAAQAAAQAAMMAAAASSSNRSHLRPPSNHQRMTPPFNTIPSPSGGYPGGGYNHLAPGMSNSIQNPTDGTQNNPGFSNGGNSYGANNSSNTGFINSGFPGMGNMPYNSSNTAYNKMMMNTPAYNANSSTDVSKTEVKAEIMSPTSSELNVPSSNMLSRSMSNSTDSGLTANNTLPPNVQNIHNSQNNSMNSAGQMMSSMSQNMPVNSSNAQNSYYSTGNSQNMNSSMDPNSSMANSSMNLNMTPNSSMNLNTTPNSSMNLNMTPNSSMNSNMAPNSSMNSNMMPNSSSMNASITPNQSMGEYSSMNSNIPPNSYNSNMNSNMSQSMTSSVPQNNITPSNYNSAMGQQNMMGQSQMNYNRGGMNPSASSTPQNAAFMGQNSYNQVNQQMPLNTSYPTQMPTSNYNQYPPQQNNQYPYQNQTNSYPNYPNPMQQPNQQMNAFPNQQSQYNPQAFQNQNAPYPNQTPNSSYPMNYVPPQYQHSTPPFSQPGHSELSALTDATNRIGTSAPGPFTSLSTSANLTTGDQSKMATVSDSMPVTSVSSGPPTSNTTVTQSITSPVTSITENSNSSGADTVIQQQETYVCGPPVVHSGPVDDRRHLTALPNKKETTANTLAGVLAADDNDPNQLWPNQLRPSNDLSRLFELGSEPDRRYFLEKLIQFLDDRCTPITVMPCISKQPLDLYKLYFTVRERGGMVEVTRVKKWKDVCTQVNISASASAAFTLKKNYIKYLFSYECQFDRGGMNPGPILAEMDAQLRQKRETKGRRDNGSSSDVYQSANTPDGYSTGPMTGYIPDNMMHSGMMPQNTPGNYLPPTNLPSTPNHIPQPGSNNISVTDPFSDEAPTNSSTYNQQRFNVQNQQNSQFMTSQNYVAPDPSRLTPNEQFHQRNSASSTPEPGRTSADQFRPSPGPYPPSTGSFNNSERTDQTPMSQSGSGYRPTAPPDQTTFPPKPTEPAMFPGNQSNQYPPNMAQQRMAREYSTPNKKFPDVDRRDGYNSTQVYGSPHPGMSSPYPNYPRHSTPQDSLDNRREDCWSPMQNSRSSSYPPNMIPPSPQINQFNRHHSRMSPQRHDKGYPSPSKLRKPMPMGGMDQFMTKRDLQFPPGSVEATQPVIVKRRKICSKDLGPTDPWRIMLALKSGLLAESTWALTTLSVLLCDDSSMNYFGLIHLPGLLDALLDHYRRLLIEIFGKLDDMELKHDRAADKHTDSFDDSNITIVDTSVDGVNKSDSNIADDEKIKSDEVTTIKISADHGTNSSRCKIGDYTMITRTGRVVKIEDDSEAEGFLDDSSWDRKCGFTSGSDDWANGRADSTDHIVGGFENRSTRSIMRRTFYYYKRRGCHKPLDSLEKCDNWFRCCEEKCPRLKSQNVTDVNNTNKTTQNCRDDGQKLGCDEKSQSSDSEQRLSEGDIKTEIKSEGSPSCINVKQEDVNNEEKLCTDAKNDNSEDSIQNNEIKQSVVIKNEDSKSDCSKKDDTDLIKEQDIKQEVMESDVCDNNNDNKSSNDNCNKTKPCNNGTNCNSKPTDAPHNATKNNNKIVVNKEDVTETDIGMQYLRGQKRLLEEILEEEAYDRDNPSLSLSNSSHNELSSRCIVVSNIIRNLSFLPGNDVEMSKHAGLLNLLSHLLLLHHQHLPHLRRKRQFDKSDDTDEVVDLTHGQSEWWWDTILEIRENTLVVLSNISPRLNLSKFPEDICLRLLDGVLHWSVCPSACARDPLPTSTTALTAQSLVLETMCKLSAHKINIDLLIAMRPFSRIIQLISNLVQLLSDKKPQVQQEFAIVLLGAMVQSDSAICRIAALQHPCISLLLDFLECAEQNALQVANTHGVNTLRDNPEVMGTSLDMLRRAASTLGYLARHADNRSLFNRQQSRILALVMSQILDQHVAQLLSDVLYECSQSS